MDEQAEAAHIHLNLTTAETSAAAGYVGLASCLIAAARRRAERAQATGAPWALALVQQCQRAEERLRAHYGISVK